MRSTSSVFSVKSSLLPVLVMGALVAAAACSSSSPSSLNPGGVTPPPSGALVVRFTSMHSTYDGMHSFTIPATVDGVQNETWSVSDPSLVSIAPLTTVESGACPGDALLTMKGAGMVTVTATTPDGRTGSAPLLITQADPTVYNPGASRALNGEPGQDWTMCSSNPYATGCSGQPCVNCHKGGPGSIQHTPQQTGGFTDSDLISLVIHGQVPPDATAFSNSLPPGWSMFHQWTATTQEQSGLVAVLRALPPAAGGPADFGRSSDAGVPTSCDLPATNPPPVDSGTPIVDSAAPPPMDSGPPTGSFPGTYQCTLSGNATVTAGGNTSTDTIPLNPEMTVTESGSTITVTLTAEGGVDCSMTFTDAGGGVADITQGQTCTTMVDAGFEVQVVLSFVMPGTLTLSNNGLTASLPFNLSAADGIATGSGTMTGPCTR